ncbi:minor head protein inhibitor of protease [Pseudomonas phage PspYZU05]|uniref:Inhibitor of prohead protease n=1 Tax=Pseudomonas phage PspYZU05 TaxID=1983556 RepID=A0A2U7N551_9CAUD|nr:minor head protein inhibitor of protease [Pseudomonas phage PspYZU05]ASD52096.1 inhibitor of prohead protease [Pseudomonas phage PspYZU05]
MDTNFINELRELDASESRSMLHDYALETFNIKLRKNKSFDNMVADLKIELDKLAEIPMPEDNDTLDAMTISDLIQADDELTGNTVFMGEASDLAIDMLTNVTETTEPVIVAPLEPIKLPEVEVKGDLEVNLESKDFELKVVSNLADPTIAILPHTTGEAPIVALPHTTGEAPVEVLEAFELPKDFSPTFSLIGPYPGYYTLNWWILDWIESNKDWKTKPYACKNKYDINTVLSLIYYIKRNGSVVIRETRNSRFHTLT